MPDGDEDGRPPSSVGVVRRAPFSDNPRVGARGLRTQQRILDAALHAFAEEGYHACTIDRIAKLARCSRVSFYQYFSGKADVFLHLAGRVARQVSAATEALEPLTADAGGWSAMRAWVGRYADLHDRYAPVFHALESDDLLAALACASGEETVERIHARLASTTLPPRQLDPVIRLLLECINHALDNTEILRQAVPDAYARGDVETALTDLVHRTLFGVLPEVNVHLITGARPPALDFGPMMSEVLRPAGGYDDASRNPAFVALLASGRDVFVSLGYQSTRVDDLVAAAGVSHGAFYRYFENKEQLARMLTARSIVALGDSLVEMPDVLGDESAGRSALRRWLRRYNAARVGEAGMVGVWLEAARHDPAISAECAPLLDWGRRRLARYLEPRGFGDVDLDGVLLAALVGVFGARSRSSAETDAAAHVIERGFLGR